MRFSRVLVAASLASVSHAWGLDLERPNPDHPGTRDIFFTYPGYEEERRPTFVAVPNFISLDQVHSIEIAGSLASFINGESWLIIGGKRVIRFNSGFFDDAKAFKRGYYPIDYPIITSGENLDELLGESMPIHVVRALAAEKQRSHMERPLMQTKRVLMHGCVACRCPALFNDNGSC